MTKEQIYDEQISPLMTQVIAICREHKIANICTFSLDECDDGESEGLRCTTAMQAIRGGGAPRTMMTVRDGDGKIKEMHAFLG